MSNNLPLISDLFPFFNCSLGKVTINRFNLSGAEKTLVSGLQRRFDLSLYTFIEQTPDDIALVSGIPTKKVEVYKTLREKVLAEYESIKCASNAIDAHNKLFFLDAPLTTNINEDKAANLMGPLSQVEFNLDKFEADEQFVLVKIKRKKGYFSLRDMLLHTHQDVFHMHGITPLDATIYARIKHKVIGELLTIINAPSAEESFHHYKYLHGSKVVEIKELNSHELDILLIEQFEEFLFKLDTNERKTLMSYYAFQSDKKTLDEIGDEQNLSKERIRQKIMSTLKKLKSEGLSNEVLYALSLYRNNSFAEILEILPNFSSCFTDLKRYGEILAFLLNLKKQHFHEQSSNDWFVLDLSDYFAMNGIAIPLDEFSNYLLSEYYSSPKEVSRAIEELIKQNKIKVNSEVVSPLNLNKIEAVASLLVDQPHGLPLKDIARIINAKGLSSSTFSENSSMGSVYSDSDYIYQSDRGTYKHQNYLPILPIELDKLFDQIKAHMQSTPNSHGMHLSDFYSKCDRKITSKLTYFELRHYIRKHSLDYGINFLGKSGVDALYIGEDSSGLNQENFVLELFIRAEKPLMLKDVAERIRSKSARHARYYLQVLMDKNKLVMLDHMRYTTPEVAFGEVDVQLVMSTLLDILKALDGKPSEFNFIKGELNNRLKKSYTKYFYEALAYYKRKEYPIHLSNTVVSLDPIPFKSINELISQNFSAALSPKANFEKIKPFVNITYETFSVALSNWIRKNQ